MTSTARAATDATGKTGTTGREAPVRAADDICGLDATALAELIRTGQASPVEVYDAHLDRIGRLNPGLNAIVTMNEDARQCARRAEREVARGGPLGPLHGVPFTVKDSFDVAGLRTTRGSLLFADLVPAKHATAVQRMADAGAIMIGKTNVPEFVLWAETDNRVFGPTKHPLDDSRTPGGSSGGEAAAIAAGLSPLGIGSDLSGSIRLPAHHCGIVGLKPTHGRTPLTGHWPDTLRGFTHVGPLARTVRDARLALRVLEGPDGRDWFAELPAAPVGAQRPLSELRVGWLAGEAFGPLDAEVAAAVSAAAATLRGRAASVAQVSIPSIEEHDYDLLTMTLYGAESAGYFAEVVAGRHDLLHPVLRARLTGDEPTLREYLDAQAQVQRLRDGMTDYFRRYDVLICPVTPVPAPRRGEPHLNVGGQQRRGRSILRATIPFDLAGLPAVSVPFTASAQGLPIGVQVVGPRFADDLVLDVAQEIART
jgi:aspartyl-tRNA(Asn)/glutamyl-tRNA(Gln) amidotransferase subunit A